MGWVIVHDRNNCFASEVSAGLAQLARKLLGPCTIVQAALPHIFRTPQSYHDKNVAIIHRNAKLVCQELQKAPGIIPIMPAGALYLMVRERVSVYHYGVGSLYFRSSTQPGSSGSYSQNWFILILQVPMYKICRHVIFFPQLSTVPEIRPHPILPPATVVSHCHETQVTIAP